MHIKTHAVLVLLAAASFAAPASAQYLLKAPRTYDSWPGEARLAGDLDADGDIDLIRFNGNSEAGLWTSFVVLQNDGGGEFNAGALMPLPANCGQHVLLTDVNGDGRQDVLVSALTTNALGAGLLFYAGQSGATFAAATHLSLGGNTIQLHAGHANSDGIFDIAVVHFEPTSPFNYHLRWILGDAANAFQAVPGLQLPISNLYIGGAAILDSSGDGIDDFVISTETNLQFFSTIAAAPTGIGPVLPITTDFDMQLRVGDIDRDGDSDLIGISTSGFSTVLLSRFRNQGNGAWTALSAQNISSAEIGVPFLGDWDADGDPDLLLRGYGFSGGVYSQLENDGTGAFQFRSATSTQLTSFTGVGHFDLNRDGKLDFADAQAVYFGDGAFRSFVSAPSVSGFGLVDWEDDGDLDIPAYRGERKLNDGRGQFTPSNFSWPANPGGGFFYTNEVLIHDFNGDGLYERLVPLFYSVFPRQGDFVEMRLFRDTPSGTIVDAGPAASPLVQMGDYLMTADVDGDNDLDIVSSTGVFLNNGAQFFTSANANFQGYYPVAKGDVDGDGDIDFIARYFGGTQSIALLRRTTPANFNVEVLYAPTTQTLLYRSSVLADLDDDGDLDIAVDRGPNLGTLSILENVGGTFALSATVPISNSAAPQTMVVMDLNHDGLSDLILGAQGRAHVMLRLGPGFLYDSVRSFAVSTGLPRFAVDIDQDGDLDLVGAATIINPRFDGPGIGSTRQYGRGLAGTGQYVPVLGGTGPLRVGETSSLRLRQGVGGAAILLLFGAAETNVPNFLGFLGLNLYTTFDYGVFPLVLGGAAGVAGTGAFDLTTTITPGLGGAVLYTQALILDPGASSGIAATNGVERSIGF